MLTRTITGFLFILTIVAGIYFNATIAMALFSLIVLLGVDEFYGLVKKSKEIKPTKFLGTLTGLSLMVILCLQVLGFVKYKLIFIPVLTI